MKGSPEFGIGKEDPEHFWNSLMRQLLLGRPADKRYRRIWGAEDHEERGGLPEKTPLFQDRAQQPFEEANADDEERRSGAGSRGQPTDESYSRC